MSHLLSLLLLQNAFVISWHDLNQLAEEVVPVGRSEADRRVAQGRLFQQDAPRRERGKVDGRGTDGNVELAAREAHRRAPALSFYAHALHATRQNGCGIRGSLNVTAAALAQARSQNKLGHLRQQSRRRRRRQRPREEADARDE